MARTRAKASTNTARSSFLRLKTVWKVSNEKYEGIEKEKTSTEHKWTSKMPALSNDKGLFANSIAPLSKTVKGNPRFSLTEVSQRDIAPVGRYTGLAIEEDVAPTTEDRVRESQEY